MRRRGMRALLKQTFPPSEPEFETFESMFTLLRGPDIGFYQEPQFRRIRPKR